MKVKVEELRRLVKKTLLKSYSKDEAKRITEIVIFGEMSGKKSHGIVRLMIGGSSMLAQTPTEKPEIISKTKLSKLINGHKNPAMLVGSIAMDEVIQIAEEYGFGIVGTNNTFSTSGCLSYYLEKIANENLIGIIMARSPSDIAPFNSKEPLFGTNPIGFAIPSKPSPLIFDMGTSGISYGALLKANATGEKIPSGVAIGPDGKNTSDPAIAMKGALLTFDNSYKSSGLSMMVEILSGVLTGASFLDINKNDDQWGNTFIAFKPDLLIKLDEFKNKMAKFVKRIKKVETRDGNSLRLPGENTLNNRNECLQTGEIKVDEKLYEQLLEITKS